MLEKKIILKKIIEKLNDELAEMEKVTRPMKDLVKSDALKSEGKYDTRAIEASYLVGAQLKRMEEIKTDIQMLEEIDLTPADKIQMGSLAQLTTNGIDRFYFFTSASGGTMIALEGNTVLTISVFSPLGHNALGLLVGESFDVETPKEMRNYLVKAIY